MAKNSSKGLIMKRGYRVIYCSHSSKISAFELNSSFTSCKEDWLVGPLPPDMFFLAIYTILGAGFLGKFLTLKISCNSLSKAMNSLCFL